jgi:glycine cleavage system T protein
VQGSASTGEFVFEQRAAEPVPSALYDEHVKLAGKAHITGFAGYLMPLWYSSIAEEHRAVRERAGLFDCTHMGVLEVSGADAAGFLDVVTTNRIADMKASRAKYGYVLDAAGNVLDDIIVYRRGADKFMVVVNAANEPKIQFYLHDLLEGRVILDAADPGRKLQYHPNIWDMRDPNRTADRRVDLALQGPASNDVVAKLADSSAAAERVTALKSFELVEERLAGMDCLICRTGYTGSKTGFEMFVDPEEAPRLWNAVLEKGGPLGVRPCGLGSRDSLRIEAGLPLYGHELDGKSNISPFEAGYGWAVKLDKDFFIGKARMQHVADTYTMEVARMELPGARGVRPIRSDDPVLDERGVCIGWVLSSATVKETQHALAYVDRAAAGEGSRLGVYYLARSQSQIEQGRRRTVNKGEQLRADLAGVVASRFAKFD